jgi:hypothetical protein
VTATVAAVNRQAPPATALGAVWIAVGAPGFSGATKAARHDALDARFGPDGWRWAHVVRGQVVQFAVAIGEYEQAYRCYLRDRPALVEWLVTTCGNVYDSDPTNVYDDDYLQPHTAMNHYQDISVRRVIAELVDDPAWPGVAATDTELVALTHLDTGEVHHLPRASGFRGEGLLEIRAPTSAGFCLSPAVVPAHDPALLAAAPGRHEWYHDEGCGHLSVEAFWQASKVVEVRYDRFLALGDQRAHPLAGL